MMILAAINTGIYGEKHVSARRPVYTTQIEARGQSKKTHKTQPNALLHDITGG
jgi:hypothetical protein